MLILLSGAVLLGYTCGIILTVSLCRFSGGPGRPVRIKKEAVTIDPKETRRISTKRVQPADVGSGQRPAKPAKRKKPKKKFSILRFLGTLIGCLFCVCIMAGSVAGVLLSMYIVQVTAEDGDTLDLDMQKSKQTTILFDRYGGEYATLTGDENRIWRELSYMPKDLQNAVIAIEDKDFRTEPGINIKRTIGAALNEFTGNRIYGARQGASTLEQQVIKNLTKDDEQDIMRKVREIFRALGLAKRYSKETVLEAYLNTVPLTGIVCGMEAGANEYFDKSVEDLTLAECATLASITKNPTKYNPFTNPEELITRRNHVLYEMYNQGYITESEYNSAKAETITLAESQTTSENATRSSRNSYYTDAVYLQLVSDLQEKLGKSPEDARYDIFSGGLRVYTSVDPTLQDAVERMMLNEDDTWPALWHEEPVIMTDYEAGQEDKIAYDEETGLPLDADGNPVFAEEDIPVYTDDAKTQLKIGTSRKENSSDTTKYVCFYERVRTQAAVAILDYDGNILAIGGGLGEKKYDLGTNRALLPHQTGSTMKPIGAYCLALDNDIITYSTPVPDTPYYTKEQKRIVDADKCAALGLPADPYNSAVQARNDVWKDWPENYGGAGGKGANMLIYDALRQSYNTVAVWVGSMVGTDYIFSFVHDTLGAKYLDSESDVDLAPIVLGSQSRGMTVVELAACYSIFYDGTYTTPHYYDEITDYLGNMYLDNNKYITTTQAIGADTAYIMNRMLTNVLKSGGTASGMAPKGEMEAAAKTGTTSNYKDYTFVGLTPYYVTAFWWGFDKPYDMYRLGGTSGKPSQLAWKELMEQVQAELPVKEFPMPDNVVQRNFDPGSGALGGGAVGYYKEDSLPDSGYALSEEELLAQAALGAQ